MSIKTPLGYYRTSRKSLQGDKKGYLLEDKSQIRLQITSDLKNLGSEELINQNSAITQAIENHSWFIEAKAVLGFKSFGWEPNLEGLWEANQGKDWYFPRIEGNQGLMSFRRAPDKGDWERHPWGMEQPTEKAQVFNWDEWNPQEVLILAPGLGFDTSGGRIGRGKGFFDRFLALAPGNCRVLGVARDIQVLEKIPMTTGDFPVGALITEKMSLIFSS